MSAPKNAWVVEYRHLDRPGAEWEVQCHFPAVDIIEWDGESQRGSLTPYVDIGQCRAHKEAYDVVQRFGSKYLASRVRFVHFPGFLKNGTREFPIRCRYDQMTSDEEAEVDALIEDISGD